MKGSAPNELVVLNDSLTITRAVERRLRKKAKEQMPPLRAEEKFLEWMHRWGILFFWASGYFVARTISSIVFPFDEWTLLFWWTMVIWCFGGPWAMVTIIDQILAKPRKAREQRVNAMMAELAEERNRRLEEAERFYASPEWAVIRRQVIEEEGGICAECKRRIKKDKDITVDHKYPRSKYPELALARDNLHVLCRRCNSRKGITEWLEE